MDIYLMNPRCDFIRRQAPRSVPSVLKLYFILLIRNEGIGLSS